MRGVAFYKAAVRRTTIPITYSRTKRIIGHLSYWNNEILKFSSIFLTVDILYKDVIAILVEV